LASLIARPLFRRYIWTLIELLLEKPLETAFENEDIYISVASERMKGGLIAIVHEQFEASFDHARSWYDERMKATRFKEGDCLAFHRPITKPQRVE